MSSIREQYRMSKKRWKNMVQKVADDSLEVMKNKYMTTLEQQQKEARERFDEKFVGDGVLIYDNPFSHPIEVDNEIKSFLDTEIAKAFKAGQESVFKRVNRKLKGWEYTFQGVCQYCSADFWNYDNAKHTSQCPMGKLEEVLNIIKSLSTEKLKVENKV